MKVGEGLLKAVMNFVIDDVVANYGINVASKYGGSLQMELTSFVEESVKNTFASERIFRRIVESRVYLDPEYKIPTVELGFNIDGEYISVHEWLDKDSLLKRVMKQRVR